MKEENKENSRKPNETLSEKFDKIDENSRKQNETLIEKFNKMFIYSRYEFHRVFSIILKINSFTTLGLSLIHI